MNGIHAAFSMRQGQMRETLENGSRSSTIAARETLNKSCATEAILPIHGKASSELGDLKPQNSST